MNKQCNEMGCQRNGQAEGGCRTESQLSVDNSLSAVHNGRKGVRLGGVAAADKKEMMSVSQEPQNQKIYRFTCGQCKEFILNY